eukprot:gene11268-2215_t
MAPVTPATSRLHAAPPVPHQYPARLAGTKGRRARTAVGGRPAPPHGGRHWQATIQAGTIVRNKMNGPTEKYVHRAYGKRLWDALHEWWQQLRWPTGKKTADDRGVSWIELALDFEAWSGINIPPELQDICGAAVLPLGNESKKCIKQIPILLVAMLDASGASPAQHVPNSAAARGRNLRRIIVRMGEILDAAMWPGWPAGETRYGRE